MTNALVAALLLLVLAAFVGLIYVTARSRADGREPGRPDAISDEVVSGLMAELRKWQAEAAHWKATAERLQRELDERR
jgi:hypothetical protein